MLIEIKIAEMGGKKEGSRREWGKGNANRTCVGACASHCASCLFSYFISSNCFKKLLSSITLYVRLKCEVELD